MRRALPALVLLGSASCGSQGVQAQRPVEPAVVVAVAEPPRSAARPSATSGPAAVQGSSPCDLPNLLYVRHEAYPRPPAFEAAAQAFDRSTEAYEQKRYLDAARGFMAAARSFLDAADVEDRRWSYGNAVSSWEMIGNLEEARAALLDAAMRDSELAEELRAMADDLHTVCGVLARDVTSHVVQVRTRLWR